VFYAPLTAIFLIAELTGGYELMIPLMIVSSLSLIVARLFEPLSSEGKKLSEKLHVTMESKDELLLSRLELSSLIETNFAIVRPGENLSCLVKTISGSTRNIFPVVDHDQKLIGVIYLDKIRQVIFDPTKHAGMIVDDLMSKPAAVVEANENLHEVLAKFEKNNQWNLPVIDRGNYVGFLSKSSILSRYRNELMETT
jgi:chloride channel protein, CIC family